MRCWRPWPRTQRRSAPAFPDEVELIELEGTYLGWLDLRSLDIPVPELGRWLAEEAGIAVSPGHWFGREGAGFARVTLAVPPAVVEQGRGRDRTRRRGPSLISDLEPFTARRDG